MNRGTATTPRDSRFRLADKIANGFYLPGGDRDDVRQEARIAVLEAERCYQPGLGGLDAFTAFVVRRRLRDAVRSATTQNQRLLTGSLRNVDEALEEPDFADLVDRADRIRRIVAVAGTLTPLERRALIHLINGSPYRYDKQLDNATQRARRKLRAA